jgi:hypothetical protein
LFVQPENEARRRREGTRAKTDPGGDMVLSYGVWLFLLGVLAAANLIIARIPSTRDMIGKLAPYQGWFGVLSVFYGLWELVQSITSMSLMAVHPPIGLLFWVVFLGNALLQIALGILLGVGTAKSFVKQPAAVARMDQVVLKLAPFQGALGIVAILVAGAFLGIDLVLL